jgi:hypothetical protein
MTSLAEQLAKHNVETFKARPELLFHSQIPKPLHGCAPRVIKGDEWWEEQKRLAESRSRFRCQACGVSKNMAEVHQWLEAHEVYDIDWERGRMTLREVVALCHLCHSCIHLGRLEMLLEEGKVTPEHVVRVCAHGDKVVNKAIKAGHHAPVQPRKVASWHRWRMLVDGKAYGPTSKDRSAWERGEWRSWRPVTGRVRMNRGRTKARKRCRR